MNRKNRREKVLHSGCICAADRTVLANQRKRMRIAVCWRRHDRRRRESVYADGRNLCRRQ